MKKTLNGDNPGPGIVSIDTEAIFKELDNLANPVLTDKQGNVTKRHNPCKVEVKLNNKHITACGVSEWERGGKIGFTFTFNPKRIKTAVDLERHLQYCRDSIAG